MLQTVKETTEAKGDVQEGRECRHEQKDFSSRASGEIA